jgi:hypothetical protein
VTSDETLELLQSAVSLRVQGRDVPERVRRELAHVEQTILGIVGPLVRKRVAAALLGCSVQALDRWIAKGVIPVEPIADGAKRMAIPTEAVLDIAAAAQTMPSLGSAIEHARERTWRAQEVANATNLIAFATSIEVSAWNRRNAG